VSRFCAGRIGRAWHKVARGESCPIRTEPTCVEDQAAAGSAQQAESGPGSGPLDQPPTGLGRRPGPPPPISRPRPGRAPGRPAGYADVRGHTIKNGLAPVLIRLMEKGWVTHLATNAPGSFMIGVRFPIRHRRGRAGECRPGRVRRVGGDGLFINLALVVGAYEGLGYGESVGALIEREGLIIPAEAALLKEVSECCAVNGEQGGRSRRPPSASFAGFPRTRGGGARSAGRDPAVRAQTGLAGCFRTRTSA